MSETELKDKPVTEMTPKEVEEYNKKTNAKFDETEHEFELKKIDGKIENEKILKDLMSDAKEYYQDIRLSPSVTARVRLAISPEMEKEIVSIRDAPDTPALKEKMYRILALLCLDDPFNKTAGWKEVDEIGIVPEMFAVIVKQVLDYKERVRKFRENAQRKAPGKDVGGKRTPAT